MSSARRRLPIAIAYGFVAAAMAYAALRLVEVVWFPEPDPSIVIWSDRSRFVWRSLIAGYAGGAAIFGGYALAARSAERSARWLLRAAYAAAAALVLQGAFLP